MKIGFVFPGQGSQVEGMGKDLYEKYDEVKNVYKKVDDTLSISLENITFEMEQEELNETKNTQIAIFTMSMGIIEILKKHGIEATASAGLSLGEYSALQYGKAFSIEEGAKIVRKRGELMQNLVPQGDWSMAAVIGLEDEQVEDVCNKVLENNKFVKAVNYNCPGQAVISGEKKAVDEAMRLAKELGARKVVELKTSGPFHTEKLKNASDELRKELTNITIKCPEIDVIKNLDASIYNENDDMVDILSNHVISPVKFRKCIETMLDMGIDTFVEVGPGKVLSGFAKKVCKEKEIEAKVINIENVETLENALNELGGK